MQPSAVPRPLVQQDRRQVVGQAPADGWRQQVLREPPRVPARLQAARLAQLAGVGVGADRPAGGAGDREHAPGALALGVAVGLAAEVVGRHVDGAPGVVGAGHEHVEGAGRPVRRPDAAALGGHEHERHGLARAARAAALRLRGPPRVERRVEVDAGRRRRRRGAQPHVVPRRRRGGEGDHHPGRQQRDHRHAAQRDPRAQRPGQADEREQPHEVVHERHGGGQQDADDPHRADAAPGGHGRREDRHHQRHAGDARDRDRPQPALVADEGGVREESGERECACHARAALAVVERQHRDPRQRGDADAGRGGPRVPVGLGLGARPAYAAGRPGQRADAGQQQQRRDDRAVAVHVVGAEQEERVHRGVRQATRERQER